ncbi:amidohydrolase family protein [Chloroflexota bacterium]
MAEKYLVIDVHNHYLPETVAKKLGMPVGKGNSASRYANQARRWMTEIESRLQAMDESGVDMAVLEQSGSSSEGLEICGEINDGYAKIAHDYPGRFIPCVHVPLEAGQEVLNEVDRAVNELGFRCISLVTSTAATTLDSEELFPLYEKISCFGLPIFIHPSLRRPLWGGTKYKMSWHVSREYDILKATVEVMYGVLPNFPDLKFVMPHHGGGIPSLKGRLMAGFDEPEGMNVPESIKGLPKTPRELQQTGLDKAFEEKFDKLYFDTAGFGGWMPITEAAIKVIRTDRLCFGTDWPVEIHEAQDIKVFVNKIKQLDIAAEDKRNILGRNVKNLLKL